jgi:hypothetical protein|tara:strand:+ start:172 stop:1011 length:840 start_codon:yes stop_codon:yes gene_type:complete
MDELFKKTNEFLVEFYGTLKELEESIIPTRPLDEYDFVGELDSIFEELWEKESKYYLFGAGYEYQDIRNCELKELTEKGVYFPFCKFKIYKKTYEERLNKFLEIHEDAEEIDFIEDQLEAFLIPVGSGEPFRYLDLKQTKNLSFTRKRTVDFIVQQAKTTGYNIIVSGDESDGALSYVKEKIKNIAHSSLLETNNNIQLLNWKGTELQFTELIKALKESNLISPEENQNTIFKRFRAFLQVDEFTESDKLKDIRKRTIIKTPFINLLETSLLNWIHKKD